MSAVSSDDISFFFGGMAARFEDVTFASALDGIVFSGASVASNGNLDSAFVDGDDLDDVASKFGR